MTHVWEAAISAAAAACSVAVLVHGDAADLNQVAHNAASSSMATQTTVNRDTARDDIDDKEKDADRPRKRCKKWGGMPVYMQRKNDT